MWSTTGAEACESLALDEVMSSLEEVLLFCFIWSFRKLHTIHFIFMWECFFFLFILDLPSLCCPRVLPPCQELCICKQQNILVLWQEISIFQKKWNFSYTSPMLSFRAVLSQTRHWFNVIKYLLEYIYTHIDDKIKCKVIPLAKSRIIFHFQIFLSCPYI